MAPQKRNSRGRSRKTPASGFPTPSKRRKRAASKSPEPTSAFEALCQVTSAELERLNNNHQDSVTPDAAGRSTTDHTDPFRKPVEENKNVERRWKNSQGALPPWYSHAAIIPKEPAKSELILPPKKKKYLHYLAETDEDNCNECPQASSFLSCGVFGPGQTKTDCVTESTKGQLSSHEAHSTFPVCSITMPPVAETTAIVNNDVQLKFNPTAPKGKDHDDGTSNGPKSSEDWVHTTFSDLLDEHISRLISQNETIVAKQPHITMKKRGRRDSLAESLSGQATDSAPTASASSATESMVKTLLSSKLTRKNLLAKQMAEQRQQLLLQQTVDASNGFSYLNPEKSAIKDLLIRTYEDKPPTSQPALPQHSSATATAAGKHSSPERRDRSSSMQTLFSRLPTTLPNRPFEISTENRVGGSLVVSNTSHSGKQSWTVLSGSEWMFVDEYGRKRVRPEVTVCPEIGSLYPFRQPAADAALVRASSVASYQSSESHPSSASHLSGKETSVDKVHGESTNGIPSHEQTLSALRGHLTAKRPAPATPRESYLSTSSGASGSDEDVGNRALPLKKRKGHLVGRTSTDDTCSTIAAPLAIETPTDNRSAAVVQDQLKRETPVRTPESGATENAMALNAACLNPNQMAAFLLKEGHSLPSFRYSCVTSSAFTRSRPSAIIADQPATSVYSAWSPAPPLVNPIIHVDCSPYGKKKSQTSLYYTSASKKSAAVSATSSESYNFKRRLILTGQSAFIPNESVRGDRNETPVNAANYSPVYSSGSASDRGQKKASPKIVLEEISDDESDRSSASNVCSKCRGRFVVKDSDADRKVPSLCDSCLPTTAPSAGSAASAKCHLETRDDLSSPTDESVSDKQMINQRLQQKIYHQQQQQLQFGQIVPHRTAGIPKTYPVSKDLAMDLSKKGAVMMPVVASASSAFEGSMSKFPCSHCGKVFSKESQLYLHSRVHDMESPARMDKRSAKHRSEGSTSPTGQQAAAGSAPTNGNPRPFTCPECNVGFRIHGHLQKHLRSKGHITQLECLGRLPPGLYAELERQNMTAKLHTLVDTADCGKAFTSLMHLAKNVHVAAVSQSSLMMDSNKADCANVA